MSSWSVRTPKAVKHNTEVNAQLRREVWTPNSHWIKEEMGMLYKSLAAGLHFTKWAVELGWEQDSSARYHPNLDTEGTR